MNINDLLTLCSCFLCGLASGTMYLYSAYAPELAQKLNLDATQSSMLGLIASFGAALTGPLSGAFVDRWGSRSSIVIGATMIYAGYFGLQSLYIHPELGGFVYLSVAMVLVGSGGMFALSSIVKCAAVVGRHGSRGLATAMPMAGFGLSAFVMAKVCRWGGVGCDRVLMRLCYVPAAIFVLTFVCIREDRLKASRDSVNEKPRQGLLLSTDKENTSISLRNPVFLKHLFVLGVLGAIGQTFIYSFGNIAQESSSFYVGLLSLSNFAGRFGTGLVLDRFAVKEVFLILSTFLLFVSQLIGFFFPSLLGSLSTLIGLSYGVCFGSYPAIICDTFGLANFSKNWGIIALAPIPGAFILVKLFGVLYEQGNYLNIYYYSLSLTALAIGISWDIVRKKWATL